MKHTLNAIMVFNSTGKKILMCKRQKEPYLELLNVVGGKIELGESGYAAAYRELEEETSITKTDLTLTHLMTFTYPLTQIHLEIYIGQLFKKASVKGDENPLLWVDVNENLFDCNRFAGDGNLGHILRIAQSTGLITVQKHNAII